MTPKEKQQAIDQLREAVSSHHALLEDIEPRLAEYYDHLCQHTGTEKGDPDDLHNGYELLCALRLLRLLQTYPLNREKIDQVLYMGEGEWRRDGQGYWQHVEGGLGQPGRHGPEVYRWEPFQVFMIVAMYGPMAWIGTETYEGDRRPTDTERVNPTTREIEDLRRLCTRFILFGPRKINKSGFAAITNVEDFMFGDYDAQVVCTANSQEQSKILFNKTKDLLQQLDPVTGRKFNGKYLNYTATEVKFMAGKYRAAELIAIPAGGKMPDGKFASRSAEDEYGSAGYTNGRSDMGQTAAVIESSMGPRREPMTVITTTASLITSGPFMEMLEATHRLLLQELKYTTGEATPTLAEDRQMCLLLEPDEWEAEDEDYLLTSKSIRRKINPMLGKIVQHSFYDTQAAESRMDETKKRETIAKLFNVYRSGRITKWIKGEEVARLQVDRRIDDCTKDQGWVVFTGLDFSLGGDWNGPGWLAARRHPSGRGTEFFADCDVWISEEEYNDSPLHPLYEQWVKGGWMHVSPGKTFQPELFVGRLDELIKKGVQFMFFGYDKYKSKVPINVLKSYLQATLGIQNPEPYVQVVSQLNSEFNGPTEDLYNIMFAPVPFISYSSSPLWPFCFNNAMLEIDNRENKRPVKANQSASCKIDPIQCINMALDLYERYEGARQ
jgi:phage terminase large subunit-like protein